VSRRLIGPAVLIGLEAAVVAVVAYVAPGRAAPAVHVFVVVAAAEALGLLSLTLARSLRPAGPSLFDQGLRRTPRQPERVAQLARLENEVALARKSAWDLHVRLVPTLREVASGILVVRHGVSLADQPERASELLGPEAWDLVRPDRQPPEHRHELGIDAVTLDRTLSTLEGLG